MVTIDLERLEAVRDVPLATGGHPAPPAGVVPCKMCIEEKIAWICGLPWSDRPGIFCTTIEGFLRAFNDRTDQAGRDTLDAWVLENFERLLRTAGDGHGQERGFIGADYSFRVALPLFLDAAGAAEAATELRAFPAIDTREGLRAARERVGEIRRQPPLLNARSKLYDRVYALVKERLKDRPADAAAAAAAVAAAVADADAAAAAAADAAADAVADAAADAAAVADAAAAAAAAADADADAAAAAVADAAAAAAADADAAAVAVAVADLGIEVSYSEAYRAAYDVVKPKMVAFYDEKFEAAGLPSAKKQAVAMLERMVALGEE